MNIKLNVNGDKVKYLARVKGEVIGSDTREDTALWMIEQNKPHRSDEFDGFPIAVNVSGVEYFFAGEWPLGAEKDALAGDEPSRPQRKRRTRGE